MSAMCHKQTYCHSPTRPAVQYVLFSVQTFIRYSANQAWRNNVLLSCALTVLPSNLL
jgi:hypothetical protein